MKVLAVVVICLAIATLIVVIQKIKVEKRKQKLTTKDLKKLLGNLTKENWEEIDRRRKELEERAEKVTKRVFAKIEEDKKEKETLQGN